MRISISLRAMAFLACWFEAALAAAPLIAGAPGEAGFRFDGQEYYLRSTEGGINEYLTEDETFKRWTTLMAVRKIGGFDDPHAYAARILENVKSSDPNAKGLLMKSGENCYVDFLLFSEEGEEPGFAEWNVWRIEKRGEGIEAVQYARRFYNFGEADGREISSAREKILGELSSLNVNK